MRSHYLWLAALVISAPAYTQTTPPAAPSVTAGAEFKGLRFDWDSVPGASWYELEYRAHQTGAFVQLGSNYPATATSTAFRLPLHLFDWTYARYRLAACNSAGCTRSSEVSVSNLRLDAVGYFKASLSLIGIDFGADSDISPDGLNFVAGAPGDFQYEPGTGYARNSGTAYVFRRAANGDWVERARLVPPIPPFIEGTNVTKVAISADGNTVVLGMPNYFREEFDELSGAAFVFHFNGSSWSRSTLYSGQRGSFGRWVGINDAGDTVTVASGDNLGANTPKRVFIYKLVGGTWQPVRGIPEAAGESCTTGVLSRDGSTVAEQCRGANPVRNFVRVHSGSNWTTREDIPLVLNAPSDNGYGNIGIGISADGNTVAAQIFKNYGADPNLGPAEVQVFKRTAGVYTKTGTLMPGAWRVDGQKNFYGLSVSVSGDGGTIAVGDSWDNGFGTGPRAAPLNPDPGHRSGAFYIYRLKNIWQLANMVKPNVAATSPSTFGHEASLNGNGQTLIVGFPNDGSSAAGIGGDWSDYDGNGTSSGAVFMY